MRKVSRITRMYQVPIPPEDLRPWDVETKKWTGHNTTKVVQTCLATRAATTAMGTKIKKGTPILHLSSRRSTGETYILTLAEVRSLLKGKITKFKAAK